MISLEKIEKAKTEKFQSLKLAVMVTLRQDTHLRLKLYSIMYNFLCY